MSTIRVIKNGRVVDPKNSRDEMADVYLKNGKIAKSLSIGELAKAEIIDAKGQVVCPGFIDVHVHLREPGQTHKETIESGSWAAAAGGFTSIVCMPNTSPAADTAGTIQYIMDTVQRAAIVHVYPTGCITKGRTGENLTSMGSLKRAGVVAITDDGDCVQNNEIMRRAMEYANMFDLPIMDHCQDTSLTEDAVMNEGEWSIRLGLKGWPAAAEDIIVARNVLLSEMTGAHVHMQHVSSAGSVDILRWAKQRKVNVTAEATPHHLALTDSCIKDYNTNFKMNPPLRTEQDRKTLIEGLKDGTIDILATDHAPHTNYEKDREFDYAPFGIIGLETCFAVSHEILCQEAGIALNDVISWITYKPAELVNIPGGTLSPGEVADITILEPESTWQVTEETIFSKSLNSPWLGKKLTGQIKQTIVSGKTVFKDGKILN
tara:strand:- start:190 stop:1485 length:1296 start_codon:yes stop_codon:yes gene_type:complete